jgi:hypothetical protein
MYAVQAQAIQGQPIQGQPIGPQVAYVDEAATPQLSEEELQLVQLLRYGRTVKLLAIIDLVFTVLNALIEPITIFLIAGPLAGVYGAIRFNTCLVTGYTAFSVLKAAAAVIQIVLIATGNQDARTLDIRLAIGVMVLSALVQLWICRLVFRFRSLLAEMSEEKLYHAERARQSLESRRFIFW